MGGDSMRTVGAADDISSSPRVTAPPSRLLAPHKVALDANDDAARRAAHGVAASPRPASAPKGRAVLLSAPLRVLS